MDLETIKRKLPGDYLRYYGEPEGRLSFQDLCYIGYKKEQEERKRIKASLEYNGIPDNLTEKDLLDFLYLRACMYLKKKPIGDFEGDAKICAGILQQGGNIVDMYDAGADPVYVACLSTDKRDFALFQKIIDQHIPF
jgi:hypothetical protein